MKKIEFNKKGLKDGIGLFILVATITGTAIGLEGCNEKSNENSAKSTKKQIVYTIENGNKEAETVYNYPKDIESYVTKEEDTVYSKYVDLKELEDNAEEAYNTGNLDLCQFKNKIDYVAPVRKLNLTSEDAIESRDTKYTPITSYVFKRDPHIVIPNKYKWAEEYFGYKFDDKLATIKYSITELESINGNEYVDYKYNIEFYKNVNFTEVKPKEMNKLVNKFGTQTSIEKGDSLTYNALYRVRYDAKGKQILDLIANEQTGMGSNNDNVKKIIKHNYNDIYKNINELKDAKESKTFKNEKEFDNYILNKKKVKNNTK